MSDQMRISIYKGENELPDIYFLRASIIESIIVKLNHRATNTFEGYVHGTIGLKIKDRRWIDISVILHNRRACLDIISWVTDSDTREQYLEFIRNMKDPKG